MKKSQSLVLPDESTILSFHVPKDFENDDPDFPPRAFQKTHLARDLMYLIKDKYLKTYIRKSVK